MGTYTIGDAAERSGFSASALRYYEGIGLVVPTHRTEAGHRRYDDSDLARLAFVARAKQLGCSLDEIADLLDIWEEARCEPVQRRFHELVTTKLAAARAQITELTALTAELTTAARRLAGPAVDGGPCDEGCACLAPDVLASAATATPPRTPVFLGVRAPAAVTCSLPPADLDERREAWRTVLAHVEDQTPTANGVRLAFSRDVAVGRLAELVVAEQACCPTVALALNVNDGGVALEVRTPAGVDEGGLVAWLVGTAA